MRVLLVAAANSVTGGGERHVADLLRLLPRRGIELGLVAPPGGDLAMLAAQAGVPFHHAAVGGGPSLAGRADLRAAVDSFEPDIVHAHGARAAFHIRLADRAASRRVVYTLHGIHVDRAGSRLRQRMLLAAERLLRDRTAWFVTVCDSDRHKGARLGIVRPGRTSVVYNGIEMPGTRPSPGGFRAEIGVPANVPLALSIGRLHEQKAQATLLRAWTAVHQAHPGAVLALIGSGPLGNELLSLATELGLDDSFRLVAPRADLASAYVDADMFCLSSLWEGLPYVVLEAMSYGLPIASTNVDGIPEAVRDGESGILVRPSDPQALADALSRMIGDPDLRARMGAQGQRDVQQRFGLERMADELVAVYERVARGGYRSQSSS